MPKEDGKPENSLVAAPTPKGKMNEEERKLYAAFIERQVKSHPVVTKHHSKWAELIEWENGNQFAEHQGGAMKHVPLKIRKEEIVYNIMKPLGEAFEGKINFVYQIAGVPNSSEMGDINASRIATQLLSHNDYINSIDNLLEDVKYDLIRTGNAFMKWTWEKGRFGYIKKTAKGEDGTESTENVKQEGEVTGFVPSVFNIRLDPTARLVKDARWLIEIVPDVPESEILDSFADVDPDALRATLDTTNEKYQGTNEPKDEKDPEEKTYNVCLYWERSSPRYEKGRHIISIKDLILWEKENPALGELPYFHFGWKRKGRSIWHYGPFFYIQDLQRNLNRKISMVAEHIDAWKPKLGVGANTILKEGAMTTGNFEIVELAESGLKPFVIPTPELSPNVQNFIQMMMAGIKEVSNVHEVTYAQLPEYATRAPASLYSMMLEQENIKIDPMLKQVNKTILEMARFRLRLMDRYYKQDRLVKVIGTGDKTSIAYFKGADLKGNFDVKLVMGVNVHQSKVIQQNMLIELFEKGIITDKNRIIKMLNMGDITDELRGDVADESRSMRENQAFVSGKYDWLMDKEKKQGYSPYGVYVHDNHELHLEDHTNLAKSEEAELWDEKRWNDFQLHIQDHFTALMALRQAASPQPSPGGGVGTTAGAGATASAAGSPSAASPGPSAGGVTPEVTATREAVGIA